LLQWVQNITESVIDRILHLCQPEDREHFLKKIRNDERLLASAEEIEKSILSLYDNLAEEWLTVYPLGGGSVSIRVGPKNSQGLDFFSVIIPLGLALFTLAELEGFKRLVEKLGIESNERLSSILEALCASRYKMKGYKVELEPPTGKGRHSDFRVNFGSEWIYFECKKEYPRESKHYKNLSKYVDGITQTILKNVKSKIPSEHRLDVILSKRTEEQTLRSVIDRLCECLGSEEYDSWQEIDGVKFAVNSKDVHVELPSSLYVRKFDIIVGTKPTKASEESAYFQIIYEPFGSRELQKMRRIIKEASDQIPKMSRGVIVIETFHSERLLNIAEEKIAKPRYSHIVSILVKGNRVWSVPNPRHSDFSLDFLRIAVQPNPLLSQF
jgi:hypothetical protein